VIIKVNSRNQVTIPKPMCEQLSIKAGDHLLVDVQDGILVLIPEPRRYAKYLQGLHGEIWKGADAQEYVNAEREAWMNSASE